MSAVFKRDCRKVLPEAAAGDGCYIVDTAGNRFLDACSGAAVSCLGHSPHGVTDAVKAQLDTIAFAHTGFFTSAPAEALAERLVARAPGDLEKVYFVSGGSEAVESAIKLARQYFLEKGESERRHVVARWQSYHGNTLGALAAGGNRWRRAQYAPFLTDAMHHIDPCHYWRWSAPGESEEDYGRRVADSLETKIRELGPETVAAFIAEPVVGATMGAVPAVPGYFRRIREICDRYGILLILDEVMCGMGRTGSLFAYQDEGIVPDIVCIAKGLGAGIQPIGAVLCTDVIHDAIESGTGFFQHGYTYMGHPAACAAGVVVLDAIDDAMLSQVRRRGEDLRTQLRAVLGDHPNVGDIRGRGLFNGVELVSDRKTKTPFSPSLGLPGKLKQSAFVRGLMIYPMSGTVDGTLGDHIVICPPFIIDGREIEELSGRLAETLEDVLEGVSMSSR